TRTGCIPRSSHRGPAGRGTASARSIVSTQRTWPACVGTAGLSEPSRPCLNGAAMRVQSLFDLTGRVAIVTGGGTHLGRGGAEPVAGLGAAVSLPSRDRVRCERVAAELRAGGVDATGFGCDVTIEAEVDALVARVTADRGRLDVMVCNAGGAFTTSYLPDASIDELRQALELNVTGTYLSAPAAAPPTIPPPPGPPPTPRP